MNVVGIVQAIHSVDLAVVLMKFVVFQFVGHINQDKKKAGNPDGQTQYVQKGIVEIFQNISDSYGEKMAEHEVECIDEYGTNTAANLLPSDLKH